MLRVLIAVEDYSELLYLQTLLKKIGFDVEGVQNERSFEEARLSLNPEIILINAVGKKLKGIEFASQIRKIRGFPKVVLLFGPQGTANLRVEELPGAEAIIDTPINTTNHLTFLPDPGQLNIVLLLEKYRRIKATLSADEEDELQLLKRDGAESDEELFDSETDSESAQSAPSGSTERSKRYKEFISQMEKPKHNGFSRERVVKYHKEIRAKEDPGSVEELEKERQAFVKAMFQKPTTEKK